MDRTLDKRQETNTDFSKLILMIVRSICTSISSNVLDFSWENFAEYKSIRHEF